MTDLTEQWKKGELLEGWYWVKKKTCEEYIDKVYFWDDIFLDGDVPLDNNKVVEVLAPVPSYEEWKTAYECVVSENEQITTLKELLTEIRGKIKTVYDMDLNQFITSATFTDDFVKKIDEVLNA